MAKLQLGGLWFRTSKDGTEYLTGTIKEDKIIDLLKSIDGQDKFYINLYPNGYKEAGDNKPDWVLYINTPEGESREPAVQVAAPAKRETLSSRNIKSNVVEMKRPAFIDDDPF